MACLKAQAVTVRLHRACAAAGAARIVQALPPETVPGAHVAAARCIDAPHIEGPMREEAFGDVRGFRSVAAHVTRRNDRYGDAPNRRISFCLPNERQQQGLT